jgi:hypothetical protein
MTGGLIELLQSTESGALGSRLADDAVFLSPVAEYSGRRDVAHILGLVSQVVSDIRPCRTWAGDGESVHAFTARVGDRTVDGMLRERWTQTGELSRVTLFLRPYRALAAAIEQMTNLLAQSPLPSRSGTSAGS